MQKQKLHSENAGKAKDLDKKLMRENGKNQIEMKWNVYSTYGSPSVVLGLGFEHKIDMGSKQDLQDIPESDIEVNIQHFQEVYH